mmetsp:Transcript_83232/g.144632  ORF Transcript_83232/g.144632 Transcript_83232/m.144632 type:complete len:202 (-) Transcript_83232:13-618(-)
MEVSARYFLTSGGEASRSRISRPWIRRPHTKEMSAPLPESGRPCKSSAFSRLSGFGLSGHNLFDSTRSISVPWPMPKAWIVRTVSALDGRACSTGLFTRPLSCPTQRGDIRASVSIVTARSSTGPLPPLTEVKGYPLWGSGEPFLVLGESISTSARIKHGLRKGVRTSVKRLISASRPVIGGEAKRASPLKEEVWPPPTRG